METEIRMEHVKSFETLKFKQITQSRPEDLVLINKKKRLRQILDFTVSAVDRMNLKENEKMYKYLEFPMELRK